MEKYFTDRGYFCSTKKFQNLTQGDGVRPFPWKVGKDHIVWHVINLIKWYNNFFEDWLFLIQPRPSKWGTTKQLLPVPSLWGRFPPPYPPGSCLEIEQNEIVTKMNFYKFLWSSSISMGAAPHPISRGLCFWKLHYLSKVATVPKIHRHNPDENMC